MIRLFGVIFIFDQSKDWNGAPVCVTGAFASPRQFITKIDNLTMTKTMNRCGYVPERGQIQSQ